MKIRFLIGGLGLLFLIVLGSFLDNTLEPRFEKNQIDFLRKNITDQLPVGTPKDQVIDYLKGNHFDYSVDKNSMRIEAVDHGVSRSPFILQDYRIIIDLDPARRLRGVQIAETSAGH